MVIRKIFLHLFFSLIMALPQATAQQHLADSVEQELKKDIPDSIRAIAMVNRAMYYETIDASKSQQYYKDAYLYAVKHKLYYPAGLALRWRIYTDIQAGKYEENEATIDSSINYLSRSGNKLARVELGLALNDKAAVFYKKGMYDSAIAWGLKSVQVLEGTERYDKLVNSYVNLSAAYGVMNLRDKQEEYIFKALSAAKQNKVARNLFSSYSMVSQFFAGSKDYRNALVYSDSAAFYFNNGLTPSYKHLFYLTRAQAYEGLNQFDSAVYYYRQVYAIVDGAADEWGMTEPLLRIGHGYSEMGNKLAAEENFLKGITLAEKNNYTVFIKTGYELLSTHYEKYQEYGKALNALKKYNTANDLLQDEDRKKMVLDLDKKYETVKKEQELKLKQAAINRKTLLNYFLAAGAAAMLLILLFAYRTYRQKRKLQEQQIAELEKEKQLLATQSLLKGQEEERTRLAKDLHDGLGGLLSGVKLQLGAMKGNLILSEEHGRIFTNALNKLDDSINEMRRVAHNMMPETLMKFGLQQALQDYCDGLDENQSFTINSEFYGLEKRMEPSTEVVIYRIVQELLNNVVKHSGASSILAQVMRHNNNVTITVEDNGKGFDKEVVMLGSGLKNVRSRVEYLKGQLDIKSEPGKGTSIHIDCIINSNG